MLQSHSPVSINYKGWDKVIYLSTGKPSFQTLQCGHLGNKKKCRSGCWDGLQRWHLLVFMPLKSALPCYTRLDECDQWSDYGFQCKVIKRFKYFHLGHRVWCWIFQSGRNWFLYFEHPPIARNWHLWSMVIWMNLNIDSGLIQAFRRLECFVIVDRKLLDKPQAEVI